jgi:hypothetical protein
MSIPNVCMMMSAIRGQPNRGLRDLSSTMARMRAASGPFGPGFFGRNARRTAAGTYAAPAPDEAPTVSRGDGEFSNPGWIEEQRPESAEQSVAAGQVGRPTARAAQNDQLLLEQKILRDHGSHATRATQPRGHDRQVQHHEQEIPHVRVSVR